MIDIDLSWKIGFRRKNFSWPKKFSQNCPKVNFQWFSAKTNSPPRFRFFQKNWIFDEKFLKIQKSQKIALKSISIEIEQFMAIFGSIKPLRVINNRSELLNAVLNHLEPFKDLLEPFRVLLSLLNPFFSVKSHLRRLNIDKSCLKLFLTV